MTSTSLLALLGSTHELRLNLIDLERERMQVVQRIAAVSAQIRAAIARATSLKPDEASFAERMLEDRQEQVNRLIIQMQQVANAVSARWSQNSRTCLLHLISQLEEEKDAIHTIIPQIQETAQQWPLADLSAEETDTWREIAAVFEAALGLVTGVLRFAAHAVQVASLPRHCHVMAVLLLGLLQARVFVRSKLHCSPAAR